jgi:hypothetical protein
MADQEIGSIELNEGEDKSDELNRLKKGCILEIKLNSELSWRKVRILTNAPLNEGEEFDRLKYNELKWIYPSHGKYDDSNRYVSLKCFKPGSFHYYFTIDGTT